MRYFGIQLTFEYYTQLQSDLANNQRINWSHRRAVKSSAWLDGLESAIRPHKAATDRCSSSVETPFQGSIATIGCCSSMEPTWADWDCRHQQTASQWVSHQSLYSILNSCCLFIYYLLHILLNIRLITRILLLLLLKDTIYKASSITITTKTTAASTTKDTTITDTDTTYNTIKHTTYDASSTIITTTSTTKDTIYKASSITITAKTTAASTTKDTTITDTDTNNTIKHTTYDANSTAITTTGESPVLPDQTLFC